MGSMRDLEPQPINPIPIIESQTETPVGSPALHSLTSLLESAHLSPTSHLCQFQTHDIKARRCLWRDNDNDLTEPSGWQNLPRDLLHLIIVHLDHNDIRNARQVCKEWKASISLCVLHLKPRRFTAIELQSTFPAIQSLDCKGITTLQDKHLVGLHLIAPSLTTLILDGCDNITDAAAEEIAMLSNLRNLSLKQCIKLSDAFFWIISRNKNKMQRQSPTSPMISPRGNSNSNSSNTESINTITTTITIPPLAQLSQHLPPPLQSLDLTGCMMLTEQGYSCLPLGFPHLTELRIGGCNRITTISDACLEYIGQCTNLQILDMSGCCAITGQGLQHIAPLSHSLKSLNLWNCLRLTPSSLATLSSFSSLTELSLRGCQWMDDSCVEHLVPLSMLCKLDLRACEHFSGEQLSRLSKLQNLREINLHGCYALSDQGMASLGMLRTLRTVSMPECWQVTAAGLHHVQHLTHLCDLNAAGCRSISNELHHPLPGLSSLSSLTSLVLKGCDRLSIGALQSIGCLTALHTLDLSGCREISSGALLPLKEVSSTLSVLRLNHCMGLKGSNALTGIEPLTSLTSLQLGGCINLVGTALSSLHGLSSLQNLSLEGCSNVPLLDRGFAVFDSSYPSLTTLSLQRCNTLTDRGLGHLGSLKQLQSVNLSDCTSITGSGFSSWSDMKKVHSLQLAGCININDEGACALAHGVTSLKELNLKHTKGITDIGIAYISHSLQQLTSLSFQGMVSLTDKGLLHLCKLNKLQHLELQFCWQFGDDGLIALAKELNELKCLDLMYSWKLTDESMYALAKYCTSLVELNVLGLHRLTVGGRSVIADKLNCDIHHSYA